MENELDEPLKIAVNYLENNGFRYAIIGGIALSQWGVVRVTHDVDIKVHVPDARYTGVREALKKAFPDRAHPQAPENPLIVAVKIEGITVDFLLALPGYEETIISRAVERHFGGWSAWFCSAEDLIIQKIVAGRGKDLSDVEALLIEQREKLDQAYILDWLSQFAEALEKPEILKVYAEIVERVNRLLD